MLNNIMAMVCRIWDFTDAVQLTPENGDVEGEVEDPMVVRILLFEDTAFVMLSEDVSAGG